MRNRWHSSFFYFFFALAAGPFPSLLMGVYLSYSLRLLKKFRWFFMVSFLLLSVLKTLMLYRVATSLPAPFPFRSLLNHSSAASTSSLLGLAFATFHLLMVRRTEQKDFLEFIQKEWPLIPYLCCCAAGALLGLLLSFLVYLYVLEF